MVRIGILALQGAFAEHEERIRDIDPTSQSFAPFQIRTAADIDNADAIILPGGESTAMRIIGTGELHDGIGMWEALKAFARSGKPMWGTCAGCILLSDHVSSVLGGGNNSEAISLETVKASSLYGDCHIGGIDVNTCRNFFGRQTKSFETLTSTWTVDAFRGFPCVFIRAPAIVAVGTKAKSLATITHHGEEICVAARQENLLVTCFHPELTKDTRIHQYFLDIVTEHILSK